LTSDFFYNNNSLLFNFDIMATAFSSIQTSENLPVAKKYIFKVLEAGGKHYDGVNNSYTIYLKPDIAMALTQDLVGKPIIIGHFTVKSNNIDTNADIIVGRVIGAFLNDKGFETADGTFYKADNASYVEGFIDKQLGVEYIEKGYLPSIEYQITDEDGTKTNRIVKAGTSNHLGLVKEPRFDTAIYSNDLLNNPRFIMSDNAKTIANGYMSDADKSQAANSEAMQDIEKDTDFKDLYLKDGEEEISLEEMWNAVGEDMEKNASKKYYDKETFIKNGKVYNIKNMCDAYRQKKEISNQENFTQEDKETATTQNEKSPKDTVILNSKQNNTFDISKAGNTNIFQKTKNFLSSPKIIMQGGFIEEKEEN
jgi:hypothetical protein